MCVLASAIPRCNTLQHTAVHCITLHHTAIHCNRLQDTATHSHSTCPRNCNSQLHVPYLLCLGLSSPLQCTATHYKTLQHTAAHCSTLQHTAAHCSTLQHAAARCSTLQHTAAHLNIMQHTATRNCKCDVCAIMCIVALRNRTATAATKRNYTQLHAAVHCNSAATHYRTLPQC